MSRPFKYILKNVNSGELFVGTANEIMDNFGIDSKSVKSMEKYGYSLKGYTCERYEEPYEEYRPMATRTNSSIDEINAKARAVGMSYGQYVGIMKL